MISNKANSTSALLEIENWSAWTSGIETPEQWASFFTNNESLPSSKDVEKADVSFLPAMQRRRLSPLARAAFFVSKQCSQEQPDCPSIFCSSLGESPRTYSLIESIAENDDVSPMAFSLSVHNAISGQFGILFNNTKPTTAIAPSGGAYISTLADALGQLEEGAESVLIVCYEETVPTFYQPYIESVKHPLAVAFRVRLADKKSTKPIHLSYTPQKSQVNNSMEHALLDVIKFLIEPEMPITQNGWTLSVA